MQRLLTIMVLGLVVAVAALGVAVYKLGARSGASARQPPAARPALDPDLDPAAAARDAE